MSLTITLFFTIFATANNMRSLPMKSGHREPLGMSKIHEKAPDGRRNRLNVNAEQKNAVHSSGSNPETGKSVGYTLREEGLYWFPIRATYHRAQKVYDKLVALNDGSFEPYLPTIYRIEYTDENTNKPIRQIKEEPLDKSLLFLRSTLHDFRTLLRFQALIPGMTPYYNHFSTNEYGRNEYLIVPDRQMESFRIIVESRNQNIIVNQAEIPKLIEGDHVIVTGGAFEGVEGVVMKFKHQKRVVVELKGVGRYATSYVPGAWLEKVEN